MEKRTWTDEEVQILEEMWGERSYSCIAKRIGRTETAIRLKAKKMKLGAVKNASDMLCAREIARIMRVDVHKVTDYWIAKYGLKCRRIKSKHRTLYVMVRHDHLMEFLKEHQDIWDSAKVEQYGLGFEPEWLREKRNSDRKRYL